METVSSALLAKKMDSEEYNLVILGDGTGSTIAAWTFAKQGERVDQPQIRWGTVSEHCGLPRLGAAGADGNAPLTVAGFLGMLRNDVAHEN